MNKEIDMKQPVSYNLSKKAIKWVQSNAEKADRSASWFLDNLIGQVMTGGVVQVQIKESNKRSGS